MKHTFLFLLFIPLLSTCQMDDDFEPNITVNMSINQIETLKELAGNKVKRNIFIDSYANSIDKFKKDSTQDFFYLFGETFFELHPSHSLSSIFEIKKSNNKEAEIEHLINLKEFKLDQQITILFKKFETYFKSKIKDMESTRSNNGVKIDIEGDITEIELEKVLNNKLVLQFYETYKNTQIGNRIFENTNKVLSKKMYPGFIDSVEKKLINTQKHFDSTTKITEDINWEDYYGENINKEKQVEIFKKTSPISAYLFPYADAENQWIEGSVLGYAKVKDTAKINVFFNRDYVKAALPANDLTFMWESESSFNNTDGEPLIMIYLIKGKATLNNTDIENASRSFNEISNSPMVTIKFNSSGTTKWSEITAKSAQNQTGIAITLNNKVFSCPVASQRITGGSTEITGGSFMGENGVFEAMDLANIINAGSLPIYYKIESIIKHQKKDK